MQGKSEQLIKTLGEIINQHRKKINKSMYSISAEASIAKDSWRRIENGLSDVKLTSFWKIADGLEIEPDVLMKELKEELGEGFSLCEE